MSCNICDETRTREFNNFISEYVAAISNGTAAIFAGAGLSIPSGELSWAALLRNDAKNIGIEIDREDDYISVAQYIYNESGTRNTITKLIKNHVDKKGSINENHQVLASLPITKYWTTNYDTYIERALEDNGKRVDVKRSPDDLASEIEDADATIYKMHGDIGQPNAVVLLKDDYEIYDKKNELFVKKLQGDLLSNTFLFIGFSFDDPNLENILSKVRIMLEGNPRRHYCFFKRVNKDDPEFSKFETPKEKEDEANYRRIKQSLKIKDLLRYGIKAIVVDDYKEIPEILFNIRRRFLSKNVFVSGSFSRLEQSNVKYKVEGNLEDSASDLCGQIGVQLYEDNYKIYNCMGIGVGRGLLTGVLNKLYAQKKRKLGDSVIIRPFPNTEDEELKKAYRTEILEHCGTAIFLFGNKYDSNNLINAPGVLQEYNVAKELGLQILAVGSTGYAAKEIWDLEKIRINENKLFDDTYMDLYEKLNHLDLSIEEIINILIEMIQLNIDSMSKTENKM